jgi:peptide deformylase
MAALSIVTWPDARLRTRCAPIGDGDDLSGLARDMLDTMYAAPGRGLAGPQVGVMKRVFVMDVTWKDGTPDPWVCINPVITNPSDDMSAMDEGCLSIPGIVTEITRPNNVTLTWTNLSGLRQSADLTGFAARCAQHELDHLDGWVTFDRLSSDRRAYFEAEFNALQQET